MLETRLTPVSLLSERRTSPVGRSMISEGAVGFDGEVKA